MKNDKGITLISLVSSIMLILILAAVTVVTSMSSYNQMKFEGAKSEIEQVEKLVDEIASDYQTYLDEKVGGTENSYAEYFKYRYGNRTTDFSDKQLSSPANSEKAKTIMSKYPELSTPGPNMFYFTQDDLNKYFDLKGINDVVVDFSTRIVYSVEGIKDPDDKNHLYYTSSEWGGNTRVTHDETGKTVATISSVTQGSTYTISGVVYRNITVTLSGNFKVSEVYYKTNTNTNKVKVDKFTVKDNTVSFAVPVPSNATYTFILVDEVNNTIQKDFSVTTN